MSNIGPGDSLTIAYYFSVSMNWAINAIVTQNPNTKDQSIIWAILLTILSEF